MISNIVRNRLNGIVIRSGYLGSGWRKYYQHFIAETDSIQVIIYNASYFDEDRRKSARREIEVLKGKRDA